MHPAAPGVDLGSESLSGRFRKSGRDHPIMIGYDMLRELDRHPGKGGSSMIVKRRRIETRVVAHDLESQSAGCHQCERLPTDLPPHFVAKVHAREFPGHQSYVISTSRVTYECSQ